MKICIDGNDGTGKSTLISKLKELMPQHEYQDRGLPSALTVSQHADSADLYVILTCPVDVSLHRLSTANRDMTEHWHLPETLEKYHNLFLDLANQHGWLLVDASVSIEELVEVVSDALHHKFQALQ